MTTTLIVRHEPEHHRFVGVLGEQVVSIADYAEQDDVVVMHHTETVPAHGGNGYAKQVVLGALEHIRSEGKQVVPRCWFVAEVLQEAPEYADMVAPPG